MDVTQAPALDTTANRSGNAGPAPARNVGGSPVAAGAAAGSQDLLDIRPLDVRAALQILIAEAGAGLSMPVDGAAVQSPTHAAHFLIQMFLENLPDEAAGPADWHAAVAAVEVNVEFALTRAVETVTNWRSVPPSVVDAAKDTRALVLSQMHDAPASPTWLRPEWLGLAPAIERYWRRRRPFRRGLTDPDASTPRDATGPDEQKAAPDKAPERARNEPGVP